MTAKHLGKGGPGKKRIGFFDAAKGIAILAVIAGHLAIRVSGSYGWTGSQLGIAVPFMFHLPTFFLVSGYFLHTDRRFAWGKEARSLLVPYVVGAVLVVLAVVGVFLAQGEDPLLAPAVTRDWAVAALYAGGDLTGREVIPLVARIGAIWFLFGLFWARLVVTVVCRAPRVVEPVLVLACFLVGLLSSQRVFLPWSIQPGLCAAAYVYAGVLARRHGLFEKGKVHPAVWVAAVALYLWSVRDFTGFGMATNGYGVVPVDYARNILGSLAGAFLCVGGLAALERTHAVAGGRGVVFRVWSGLMALGRMTLPVLCVHVIEDNALPWGMVLDAFATVPHAHLLWPLLIVARCAADILVAWLLMRVPVLGRAISGRAGARSA